MNGNGSPANVGSNDGLGLVPERADVAAVMTLVWSLVRSGPNFDGRQFRVQRAVAAAIDAAVAAERERCATVCEREICACCWDDAAQAAAEHLAAEIRKGPNVEVTGKPPRGAAGAR